MPPRRCAPGAEAFRVDIILACICPQPADSRFAVLKLGREDCVLAQSVIDAGDRIASADKPPGRAVAFITPQPGTAVHPDYQRHRPAVACLLMQIQIQLVALVAIRDVFNVAQSANLCIAGGDFGFFWLLGRGGFPAVVA